MSIAVANTGHHANKQSIMHENDPRFNVILPRFSVVFMTTPLRWWPDYLGVVPEIAVLAL